MFRRTEERIVFPNKHVIWSPKKSPLRCIFSSYGYGGFRGGIHLNVVSQMKSASYPSIYETATQLTEKGGLALAYKVATLPAVRGCLSSSLSPQCHGHQRRKERRKGCWSLALLASIRIVNKVRLMMVATPLLHRQRRRREATILLTPCFPLLYTHPILTDFLLAAQPHSISPNVYRETKNLKSSPDTGALEFRGASRCR